MNFEFLDSIVDRNIASDRPSWFWSSLSPYSGGVNGRVDALQATVSGHNSQIFKKIGRNCCS